MKIRSPNKDVRFILELNLKLVETTAHCGLASFIDHVPFQTWPGLDKANAFAPHGERICGKAIRFKHIWAGHNQADNLIQWVISRMWIVDVAAPW